MRKNKLLIIALVLCVRLYGQDSLKTQRLEEIVVSSSRLEQKILDVPRSIFVIDRNTIEQSAFNSVGELISHQRGLFVVGGGQTPGTNQSVFMRGMNSNQVAVLIDGVRIYDPSSPNSAIDLSEISTANVERIEILHGGHSTMYGGAAIGGVINIITRKNGDAGVSGVLSLQGGALGGKAYSMNGQADVRYQTGHGLYVNGSLFHQNVNGLDASAKRTEGFTTRDRDGFVKTDVSVATGLTKKNLDFRIGYRRSSQDADIDGGAFRDDDNNKLKFSRNFFDYNFSYAVSPLWKFTLLGSYSNSKRINTNDSSLVNANGATDQTYFKGNYFGNLNTHELQAAYTTDKLTATIGVGVNREEMNFNTFVFLGGDFPFSSETNYDSIQSSATTTYAFAQANYRLGQFGVEGGARLSHHSLFGNVLTVEANPYLKIGQGLAYASVSSAFNAPSLYQLYDPQRGNRQLDAEQSLSIELGYKHQFKAGHYITASAFRNEVDNAIEYVYLWTAGKPVDDLGFGDYEGDTYLNIASLSTWGGELEAYWELGDKLSILGHLSLLSGEISARPSDINAEATRGNQVQLYSYGTFLSSNFETEKLSRRPASSSFVQLNWKPISQLSISPTLRYVASRPDVAYDFTLGPFGALGNVNVDSYYLFGLQIGWQNSRLFNATFRVENVFDEQYAEIAGFNTRGRAFYLKLTHRF